MHTKGLSFSLKVLFIITLVTSQLNLTATNALSWNHPIDPEPDTAEVAWNHPIDPEPESADVVWNHPIDPEPESVSPIA